MKSGVDSVQCVEAFPDSMNHCVPDWDATGEKEIDNLWEQPDFFSPRKGKWDSGPARKSDLGFVPELDFEELCWEDGQLLVVMQGLSSRGTAKNRSTYQTDDTALLTVLPTTGTFDTPRPTELDLSSVNMQTQEDELFSWLQHPPEEDLVERLEVTSDLPMVSASFAPISKLTKSDTPQCMGNRIGHEYIDQQNELSAEPMLVPTETTQKEVPCEPCLALTAETETSSRSLIHSGFASMQCEKSRPNRSATAINFPNFSRSAVKIKADLQSLGIVNGLTAPERLKQLEKVAVNMRQSESTGDVLNHPKVIAPRKEISAAICQNVEASFRQDAKHKSRLQKEAEKIASAGCREREFKQYMSGQKGADQEIPALTKHLRKQAQSDAWNSSYISSINAGKDAITEVLEIPEPSDTSSSGGANSDCVNEKRGSSTCKRKTYDEDSEIQSEDLENEITDNKKGLTAGGNDSKKSRAAENHNQSERRRRDRIGEKMKALQALLPNSYKTDKASLLEEAISYIKALKSQIQMMSRGSSMYFSPIVPSHGVQHVQMAAWPLMNMGVGMNMGMGMNSGMGVPAMNTVMAPTVLRPVSLPMMAFPNTIGSAVQTSASAELSTAHTTPGIVASVFPSPHHQLMAFIRPGNLMSNKSDSTQVGSAFPTPRCPPPSHQLGHMVQGAPASFVNGCG